MQSEGYILFGAGKIGNSFIDILGCEKVLCFVDNSSEKIGKSIKGIQILSLNDIRESLKDHCVIVTVDRDKKDEIMDQLKQNNAQTVLYYEEIKRELTRKKIESRINYIEIYDKAIKWLKSNIVESQGIINNSGVKKPYPEVTGYFIPSLLQWGYRDIALSFAKWLCEIQKPDGSWYDTEDKEPYIFDSAQILKGLLSIRHLYSEADVNIRRGCDWILGNMREDGRLPSPRENDFGDGRIYSEIIHIYCLSPLIEAGKVFNVPEYIEKAYRILSYYKEHEYKQITQFGLLSHFYAYVMEGLLDMGEEKLAREAMESVSRIQKESGAVPAYSNVNWVCTTGMFQLALVWFRLGELDRGNKAFQYACRLQNASGGWFGSCLSDKQPDEVNTYFPNSEISWAVKYFLDALYWKNKAEFEEQASRFKNTLSVSDGRYLIIEDVIGKYICNVTENPASVRIADIGCGKGAYLKNLIKKFPGCQYVAVDLSETVMDYIENQKISIKQGTLTNIPYDDNTFDFVYTCEALEHAVDIENAIREMARVTKPDGMIAIIDKNKDMLGYFEIGEWEQWFDEQQLSGIMQKYCETVHVIKDVGYEKPANGLFYAWLGKVE
ncbi:MAG: methyltransferase domain-containing protein [Lachnospiraceae bacterium]|nr:methyltransferase domain-containing protein [Lachnospiraceae bacterium]